MQQPKKRKPKEMAPRAYNLFKRAERTGRTLTLGVICSYTGYSTDTAKGYISKKYSKHFLHRDGHGGYTVNGISQITRAEFLSWHSQVSKRPLAVVPQVIVKEVERRYILIEGDIEMWLVIAILVIAGLWWNR